MQYLLRLDDQTCCCQPVHLFQSDHLTSKMDEIEGCQLTDNVKSTVTV